MKKVLLLALGFTSLTACQLDGQEFLDRLDEALTVSTFHDQVRTRVSGLLDLEGYFFQQPAPGLIHSRHNALFNPRLTLFLDSQLGSHVYLFAQGRVDRGFDPSDQSADARADEYAIRITPWEDGRVNVQAGKFGTIVGNWVYRHLSWENPFITAPLPYENITAIYDEEAPSSAKDFTRGIVGDKYEYAPVIWGPSYASGASVFGRLDGFDYAAEIKNASLSSRPESWPATDVGFSHPTFSGHLGFRPNEMWNLGFSASAGSYFREEALSTLPPGRGLGDYHQYLLGQDIGFAWHHFQLWAEFFESRFQVPNVGNADTFAYYLEAKYKFAPQLFGAVRWNQHLFASVPVGAGARADWGNDLWRTDASLGFRLSTHAQLKFQYSLQHAENAAHDFGHLGAIQFTVRF